MTAYDNPSASSLGVAGVRPGYDVDVAALSAWMSIHVDGFVGPLTIAQFKGGQSNPTYKLTSPRKTYVLRRKPPGVLLKGAHAIDREARVLSALGKVDFPVAHVYALCTDESVIGTWFYVMEMVEGRIFWDATVPGVSRAHRSAIFDAMNQAIAQLHSLDATAIGLADYGRPGNFFARQIARWSNQYLEDTAAGRDANMDRLVAWLPEHIPDDEHSAVVHGDFRIDNIIFHPSEPRILAVLDWELSTLGHSGSDFAYNAMMYRMPPNIVAGLIGADIAAMGIPSEAEYLAAYCARTGRGNMPHYKYYMAFNLFRLAAIFHGIKGRVHRGTASSASAKQRAESFPELAKLAVLAMDGV